MTKQKTKTKIDMQHATKKELIDIAESIIKIRNMLKKTDKRLIIKKCGQQ